MRAIHAAVFDMDGTLADTEGIYRDAFLAAARGMGHAVRASFYASLVGVSSVERRALLLAEYGPGFPLEAFVAEYRARKSAVLAAGVPLCDGALPLLAALRAARIPCAVATGATRPTAYAVLGRAGLLPRLGAVVTRDDVARGKPDAATHSAAAAALGVPPAGCLALEDSAPGLAAARAAGMQALLVGEAGLSLGAVLALWQARAAMPA